MNVMVDGILIVITALLPLNILAEIICNPEVNVTWLREERDINALVPKKVTVDGIITDFK